MTEVGLIDLDPGTGRPPVVEPMAPGLDQLIEAPVMAPEGLIALEDKAPAVEPAQLADAKVTDLEAKVADLQAKLNPQETLEQFSARRVSEIDAQANTALKDLVDSGVSEREATIMVGLSRELAVRDVTQQAEKAAMFPMLQQAAAAKMAAEMSTEAVKINPADLAKEETLVGMQARARAILEFGRNQANAVRADAGVDHTEGGAENGAINSERWKAMSTTAKIAHGLDRLSRTGRNATLVAPS